MELCGLRLKTVKIPSFLAIFHDYIDKTVKKTITEGGL